jgi:hypothetical protein
MVGKGRLCLEGQLHNGQICFGINEAKGDPGAVIQAALGGEVHGQTLLVEGIRHPP